MYCKNWLFRTLLYMIRKYVILQTFFNPENWLADKNQLFPCLEAPVFPKLQLNPWPSYCYPTYAIRADSGARTPNYLSFSSSGHTFVSHSTVQRQQNSKSGYKTSKIRFGPSTFFPHSAPSWILS